MSEAVYVETLPECDFCGITAQYDSATVSGPWAYMCTEHWAAYGVKKLGTGFGQKLLVKDLTTS